MVTGSILISLSLIIGVMSERNAKRIRTTESLKVSGWPGSGKSCPSAEEAKSVRKENKSYGKFLLVLAENILQIVELYRVCGENS